MIYTKEESLEQVLERSQQVRKQRERRRLGLFSLGVCALLLTLTLALNSVPLSPPGDGGQSSMGSFLLDPMTGGILAAIVLAFLLGVLITLFCIRQKRNSKVTSEQTEKKTEE